MKFQSKFAAVLALVAATLMPALVSAAPSECAEHYAFGQAPAIKTSAMMRQARELCSTSFVVMHSGITRTPLWSAEHLTRDGLEQAHTIKRVDSFHTDERLPANERAELHDYSRSGFDRGHMSPNGDMPNTRAQGESFALSNMIPQDPNNNRNLWEGIEAAVRTKTKQRGDLYVITGPLFTGKDIQRLNGRVMVPTQIFKAVYDPHSHQAGAYIVKNAPGMDYEIVSIAALEEMAGIDLFPGMPTSIKESKMALPAPTPHGNSGGDSWHKHSSSSYGEEKVLSYALHHMMPTWK